MVAMNVLGGAGAVVGGLSTDLQALLVKGEESPRLLLRRVTAGGRFFETAHLVGLSNKPCSIGAEHKYAGRGQWRCQWWQWCVVVVATAARVVCRMVVVCRVVVGGGRCVVVDGGLSGFWRALKRLPDHGRFDHVETNLQTTQAAMV
jgi:hypothetical protein